MKAASLLILAILPVLFSSCIEEERHHRSSSRSGYHGHDHSDHDRSDRYRSSSYRPDGYRSNGYRSDGYRSDRGPYRSTRETVVVQPSTRRVYTY
jgi:hypothetical protein